MEHTKNGYTADYRAVDDAAYRSPDSTRVVQSNVRYPKSEAWRARPPYRMTDKNMIHAISNNSFLSALFGPGLIRGLRSMNEQVELSGSRIPGEQDAAEHTQPVDTVEISGIGSSDSTHEATVTTDTNVHDQKQGASLNGQPESDAASSSPPGSTQLSTEEQQEVKELKQRDQEVRRHEQAHKAAAGPYARGGPQFEYETGPDGRQYAVSGEVNIDTSAVPNNPEETIRKMQQVRRAALAPGDPSGQDRAVAARAQAVERTVRAELAGQRREQTTQIGQGSSAGKSSEIGQTTANGKININKNVQTFDATGSRFNRNNVSGTILDLIA